MKGSKAVVLGGVFLALLGMVASYLYTANAGRAGGTAALPSETGTGPAYVALADLTVGSTWEELAGSVELRQVPLSLRPANAISDPAEAAGKTLVRSMAQGEILTEVQFNPTGAESLRIPEGQSALTLSMPAPQGVADYIHPGSKVNLFVTFKGLPGNPDPLDSTLTQLLLSDVTVLANRRALSAKAQAEGAEGGGGNEILLTFAVTIEQAERIIFAKENGSVWLTLMHPADPPGVGAGRTYRTVLL